MFAAQDAFAASLAMLGSYEKEMHT